MEPNRFIIRVGALAGALAALILAAMIVVGASAGGDLVKLQSLILLLLFLPINVLAFVNPGLATVRIFTMVFLLGVGASVLWTRK
ncbi:hypothetical protein ANRL1_02689 [Anaerolineae bacterium]|nr:hypothetical protein ANRL1_02689 [Anaerolineae bacterium]